MNKKVDSKRPGVEIDAGISETRKLKVPISRKSKRPGIEIDAGVAERWK